MFYIVAVFSLVLLTMLHSKKIIVPLGFEVMVKQNMRTLAERENCFRKFAVYDCR